MTSPPPATPDWLFYDGHCGLCHRTVRFAASQDRLGTAFRFAPLQGERFAAMVSEQERARLPDSIVLRTADAQLLVRSEALTYILRRLGGKWRPLASLLALIPRPVRDAVYDFIARIRYRLFKPPEDLCPVISPQLRSRFDLH